jgi:DNA-binding NarL/FixJ family response regulator
MMAEKVITMVLKKAKRRILLVDDHPIVRQGLEEMINQQDDLNVCGTAENVHTALTQIEKIKPDLVVLDISLQGNSGLELLKDIKVRYPDLPVLMLSMHDENLYAMRAIRAGARGYLMKHESTDQLLVAIRQVLDGEIHLSKDLERKMLNHFAGRGGKQAGSPIESLSDRELQVFTLIGQGFGTRQIADKLHLSIKTVESHRAHIKEKLNLSTATELLQHAIQWQNADVTQQITSQNRGGAVSHAAV